MANEGSRESNLEWTISSRHDSWGGAAKTGQTIADLYKERWKVEQFFRWIKQNLKIKTKLIGGFGVMILLLVRIQAGGSTDATSAGQRTSGAADATRASRTADARRTARAARRSR